MSTVCSSVPCNNIPLVEVGLWWGRGGLPEFDSKTEIPDGAVYLEDDPGSCWQGHDEVRQGTEGSQESM